MSSSHDEKAKKMQEQIDQLHAELALAKQQVQTKEFTLKVSPKGAVQINGLRRRFPVTLYAEEMEMILSKADDIKEFIASNGSALTRRLVNKIHV